MGRLPRQQARQPSCHDADELPAGAPPTLLMLCPLPSLVSAAGSSQRLGSGGPVSWAEVQAKMCIDERLNTAGSGRPAGTGARTKVTILKPLV